MHTVLPEDVRLVADIVDRDLKETSTRGPMSRETHYPQHTCLQTYKTQPPLRIQLFFFLPFFLFLFFFGKKLHHGPISRSCDVFDALTLLRPSSFTLAGFMAKRCKVECDLLGETGRGTMESAACDEAQKPDSQGVGRT